MVKALRTRGRLLVLGLILLGLAAMAAAHWVHRYLTAPLDLPETGLVYTLPQGGSLSASARDLEAQGILPQAEVLLAYARLSEQTAVKAGEYQLEPGLTPRGLLDKFVRGEVIGYQITFVEGWTYRQALAALQAHPKITVTLPTEADALIAALDLPVDHPEGWFFPDTYHFVAGTRDAQILHKAYRAMVDTLEQAWAERAETVPYDTPYEALIMASIVERETGVPEERGEIAGVFVRRLEKGMRLQTDPTVIYGLGEDFDGNLRRRHLSQDTPYNTYTRHGLPPTPIALPGREAIVAALNPEPGDTLYFVAKGDGSHQFSRTLAEHNRAVRDYQLRRREDYRSSPPPATVNEASAKDAAANAQPQEQQP